MTWLFLELGVFFFVTSGFFVRIPLGVFSGGVFTAKRVRVTGSARVTSGTVDLFVDRAICLSCLGDLVPSCQRWEGEIRSFKGCLSPTCHPISPGKWGP